MERRPDDLDAARAAVAARGLTGAASGHLTAEVAMALPFEALGPFKTLLKRFFSDQPWSVGDVDALDSLVRPHLGGGWWEHDLDSDLRLAHGARGDRYHLWVTGVSVRASSVFDRVFSGPVLPEATPHPRKVKFVTGGDASPGVWHLRDDDPPDDARARRILAEPDVTDVMVAGDFVTIGLARGSSWEERLDDILALVTELFSAGDAVTAPLRTRDQLVAEAGRTTPAPGRDDLHLVDPDDPAGRDRLLDALADDDPRRRRMAVAVLAESGDDEVRRRALRTGAADPSRIVRRTAVDTAADGPDEHLRHLFETALGDGDPWTRWKAVRSLGEMGVEPSRDPVAALADDPDFQVRFEVARTLRLPGAGPADPDDAATPPDPAAPPDPPNPADPVR